MKILAITLVVLTSLSCSNFMNRSPSSSQSQKPRHIIITVHGLTGNNDTFGHFHEATKNYLPQINTSYTAEIYNFIYPTGRNEKYGSTDFAIHPEFGLSRFINDKFKNDPLGPEDKISFVCHSQGGIVTYMWFFASILHQNNDLKFVKQVDSIITLGTPFWGSKVASILTDNRNPDVIPLIKLFAPDSMKMTRKEISDLAFASDAIYSLRSLAIKLDSSVVLAKMISELPVRMVNITGVLPTNKNDLFAMNSGKISDLTYKLINFVYKIFTKSYRGNKRIESDLAVPVTSSRWNFIYSLPKVISADTVIDSSEFSNFRNLVSRSKFLFTESAHMPFETENTLSMAYIGKQCLAVDSCNHPTYRYILEQLADCKESSCEINAFENIVQKMKAVNNKNHMSFKEIRDNLQSFSVQLEMKLPPGTIDAFPVKYFKIKSSGSEEFGGYDNWEFNEYSLEGRVIDLMTDKKTQISKASTSNATIILADDAEKHSVDIVSRRATQNDPFDRLRFTVFGRVETNSPNGEKTYNVPLEIRLPHLPKVRINALVQPTHSTYVELDYSSAILKK